jgi:hypothetical protein
MLAAEGLRFYFVDNESVYIEKRLDHCETSNPQRENYTEQELIDAFAKIPTQQS